MPYAFMRYQKITGACMPKILAIFTLVLFAFPGYALEVAQLKNKLPDDKVLGKSKARVTLIEYASLSCPHCADFHNRVLPTIQSEYIDTGKVKFIYRDYPLNAPALMGSQIAHCAGKGDDAKYYATIRKLLDEQKNWAGGADFKDKLMAIAKDLGMDAKAFDACVANKEFEEKIIASRQNGAKMGVTGTPGFFINGEKADIRTPEEARKALNTVLSGKTLAQEAKNAIKKAMVVQPDDIVAGQAKAKVTIIEYANIACPHCGQFHKTLLSTLQKDYIDTGKVRLVFREMPMSQSGFYAYSVAHCKGKEGYLDTLSLLFDDVQSWASTPAFITPLRVVAEKAGITKEAFYACLEDKEALDRITKHSTEANVTLGLKHSPAIFINGEHVEGLSTPEAIRSAVESTLNGKKK